LARRALRLGFAGTPTFSVPALEALAGSEHAVQAVFTKPDRPTGRGRHFSPSPVKRRAVELGLAVLEPLSFKSPETLDTLRALDLDALVVVAYGLILPPAALAAPRLGCFNIHASLLPRWRGAAPIQRALLAGDAITGVTIMRMEAGLDTGPLLAVRSIDIEDGDTGGSLHDRLAVLGAALLGETLDALARGPVPETPQPEAGVTYAQKISKAEAEIDWREDAAQVLRKVRAFNPAPVAQTRWGSRPVRIWEAELAAATIPRAGEARAGAMREGAMHEGAMHEGAIHERAMHEGAIHERAMHEGAMREGAMHERAMHERAIHERAIHAGAPCAGAPPGTVIDAGPRGIDVACGRGALRVTRLQLPGRKPMTAADILNSERLAGASFSSP
jgi:methionyl-tRNA formyltransferase